MFLNLSTLFFSRSILTQCSRVSLLCAHQVQDEVIVDWPLVLSMLRDAARGIDYLHHLDPPVIHRDLVLFRM